MTSAVLVLTLMSHFSLNCKKSTKTFHNLTDRPTKKHVVSSHLCQSFKFHVSNRNSLHNFKSGYSRIFLQ